jgi:excinuclease ABC subunit C
MSSSHREDLKESVGRFPDTPGVYLMKSRRGRVIYVGKAKSLASRVRSYVQRPEALDVKTAALMDAVENIDYIATNNEVEPLVLECSLIKEHRPRYNIRLKDDKRYPYLKLTLDERFPRLVMVRRVLNDGAEYFGPFTDGKAVRRTLRTIRAVFPLRDCGGERFRGGGRRECLDFHIGRCRAPCTGRISEEDYGEIVAQVRLFLKGRNDKLRDSLAKRMWRLSRERRYEEAAAARDQIEAFETVSTRQIAVSPAGTDEDFLALAREGNLFCGVVLKIRGGTILGSESFLIPTPEGVEEPSVFEAFFELYYHSAAEAAPRIYVEVPLAERELLAEWLGERLGRRVKIMVPRRGTKAELVRLAHKNARLHLLSSTQTKVSPAPMLGELKDALGLSVTPARIEAYDISNIQGAEAVGSMVSFVNGRPLKAGYRHFKIRSVEGSDDFAMMREVLSRRLAHVREGHERHPDLILVDGGRGQVSAARQAMERLELAGIPVIGLAKKNEEIYVEGRAEPLRLPKRSQALRLLQRIRDEAHRFAITYHRKLRHKKLRLSELDGIPGIGERRKTALLVEFGSVDALKSATVERIAAVAGIGGSLAEKIFAYLHQE